MATCSKAIYCWRWNTAKLCDLLNCQADYVGAQVEVLRFTPFLLLWARVDCVVSGSEGRCANFAFHWA